MSYSYARHRDEVIVTLSTAGLDLSTIRRLLSLTQTAHRLAVASCNGDWPADNGERKTALCPKCECGWHPSSFKRHASQPKDAPKLCPDCYNEARLRAVPLPAGVSLDLQGDPRGCVVSVVLADGRSVGLPARER